MTGGALSLDAGPVTACTFTQNTATTDGGAIVCGDVTVTGSIFTSNAASGKGGAAHAQFGQSTFTGCEMSMNDATASGGGIYVEDLAILNILDSTLCMNTPDQFAFEGALLASNVFGCDITCPESDPVGACCLNDGSCVELTQTTCAAVGGTYQGDDSLCADASCPAHASATPTTTASSTSPTSTPSSRRSDRFARKRSVKFEGPPGVPMPARFAS